MTMRPLAATATLSLAALAGGCDWGGSTSTSDSIFGIISLPTPAQAVQMYINPYNADDRVRGGNLLANAPFGGAEPYIEMHVVKLGGPPGNQADPDPGVRAIAARALGLHGRPEHVQYILPLLKEPNRLVRLEAVRALQRLHNPIAVNPLLDALRVTTIDPATGAKTLGEEDADVRAGAASALGQYADPHILQALIGALDDPDFLVTRNAESSLVTLTGKHLGDDPAPWLAWLRTTSTPFAGRTAYMYPIFDRDYYWFEYLPFVPTPPNEVPGTPAGIEPLPLTPNGPVIAGPALPPPPTTPPKPGTPTTPAPAAPLTPVVPATPPANTPIATPVPVPPPPPPPAPPPKTAIPPRAPSDPGFIGGEPIPQTPPSPTPPKNN